MEARVNAISWSLFLMLDLFGNFTCFRLIEQATLTNSVYVLFGVFFRI